MLSCILFHCYHVWTELSEVNDWIVQCADGSRHFAVFSVTRCLRCGEAGHSNRSRLGSDLPHGMVMHYYLSPNFTWLVTPRLDTFYSVK